MSSFPTCQVCHQEFSLKGPAPFLLPCLHPVCETCVTSAAGGVISCSTCQRDVNLTETPLEKDVIREKMILHLTAKQHPELILCTHENDGNQAVCWCKECEDFLCENCQMVHGRLKFTRRHVVEDIIELRPESFDVDTYCMVHPRFIVDIWDEQCCISICRKCQVQDHAGHKTVEFDLAVETASEEVADLGREVQSTTTKQETHFTVMETDLQASDETSDNLTENISHTFNSLKTLINQREKELQIELQQHQEKVRREFNEKKNISDACQKKCQTTSDYISKTLQYSSRHDLMSLRHLMQSKTGECTSSAQAVVHESPPLPRLNTDGLEKIKSVLIGFGAFAWTDDPGVTRQISDFEDCGSQTNSSVFNDCKILEQELLQLKTLRQKDIHSLKKEMQQRRTAEKEIKSLKETLAMKTKHEENGVYILTTDVPDVTFLLKCIHVEFSWAKYNAKRVFINTWSELNNRSQTIPPYSHMRLRRYRGTTSTVPISKCELSQYFEVTLRLCLGKALYGNKLLIEIGLAREEEQDEHDSLGASVRSYSFTVAHCTIHNSICRKVWRHGEHLLCLSDTLENTPGTSVTLHYGVVYDTLRSRIGFLDVRNDKVIGKIDNVDSAVDLWPMFGLYSPHSAIISMSLVVRREVDMAESKKALLFQCLS